MSYEWPPHGNVVLYICVGLSILFVLLILIGVLP